MAAALQKAGLVSKEQAKAVEQEQATKERSMAEESLRRDVKPARQGKDEAQEG